MCLHLQETRTRRGQQAPVAIPVGPLEIVQEHHLTLVLQPVADTHPVDGLLRELAACVADAFDVQDGGPARLRLFHPRVPVLIPGIVVDPRRGESVDSIHPRRRSDSNWTAACRRRPNGSGA